MTLAPSHFFWVLAVAAAGILLLGTGVFLLAATHVFERPLRWVRSRLSRPPKPRPSWVSLYKP